MEEFRDVGSLNMCHYVARRNGITPFPFCYCHGHCGKLRSDHHHPAPASATISHCPHAPASATIFHCPAPASDTISQRPAPASATISHCPAPASATISQRPAPASATISHCPAPASATTSQRPAPASATISQRPAPASATISHCPAPASATNSHRPEPASSTIFLRPVLRRVTISNHPAPASATISHRPEPASVTISQNRRPEARRTFPLIKSDEDEIQIIFDSRRQQVNHETQTDHQSSSNHQECQTDKIDALDKECQALEFASVGCQTEAYEAANNECQTDNIIINEVVSAQSKTNTAVINQEPIMLQVELNPSETAMMVVNENRAKPTNNIQNLPKKLKILKYCYEKNELYVQCLYCEKIVGNIVNHYVTCHPGKEVLISRLSEDAAKLAMEQGLVVPPNHRKMDLSCRFCDYSTNTVGQFFNHTATHTGEYRFQCGRCDAKFNLLKSFTTHHNKYHYGHIVKCKHLKCPYNPNTTLKGFLCLKCNYCQIREQGLIEHSQNSHKDNPPFVIINMAKYVPPVVKKENATPHKRTHEQSSQFYDSDMQDTSDSENILHDETLLALDETVSTSAGAATSPTNTLYYDASDRDHDDSF